MNNNIFSQITLLPVNTSTSTSNTLLNLNNISNINSINNSNHIHNLNNNKWNGISNINGGGNGNHNNHNNNNNNSAALAATQLKNNMLARIANQLDNLQNILRKYNNEFTVPVQSFTNKISCGNINNQSSLLVNDVQSVINLQNKMWKELLKFREVADKELAMISEQTMNLSLKNAFNSQQQQQKVILVNQSNNIGNIMLDNHPAIVLLGNNGNMNVNTGNQQQQGQPVQGQPVAITMTGINSNHNNSNLSGIINIDPRMTRHLQDSLVNNGQNNQFALYTNNNSNNNGIIGHVDTESNTHIQLQNHFSNNSNSTTTNVCNSISSISNISNSNLSNISNISSSNLSNISNSNSSISNTSNSSSISNPFLTSQPSLNKIKSDPFGGINSMINDHTKNDENIVGQQFLNKDPDPMFEDFVNNNFKYEQVTISSEHKNVQRIRKERKERKERRENNNNDVNVNPTNSDKKKRKRRGYNGPYSEEEKKFMKDFAKNETTEDIIELSIKMENKFKVKRSPYGLAQKMYQMGIINSRLKAIFQVIYLFKSI